MPPQIVSRSRRISPAYDKRYRVTRSERIWVISRYRVASGEPVKEYTILESIERCVYTLLLEGENCVSWGGRLIPLEDQQSEYVRFLNRMYPLHPPDELNDLVLGAKRGDFELHNNQAYDDDHVYESEEVLALTKIASFIFDDEKGPFA